MRQAMRMGRANDTAPPHQGATERMRLCLASGERRSEVDLVRFVIDPNGTIVPDVAAKLPGRGLWVTASRDRVLQAIRKQAFMRGAKRPVIADLALADQAADLIFRRCLNFLGLACRAGELTFGFEKARKTIRAKSIAALIEAQDGSADGRRKILGLGSAHALNVPVIGCFTGTELGLALGRDYVVHAALEIGALAQRFLADVRRLSGFREICPQNWGIETPENLIIAP